MVGIISTESDMFIKRLPSLESELNEAENIPIEKLENGVYDILLLEENKRIIFPTLSRKVLITEYVLLKFQKPDCEIYVANSRGGYK